MSHDPVNIIEAAMAREVINQKNQAFLYKIKCFVERMKVAKRPMHVIKAAVKAKFNVIITE